MTDTKAPRDPAPTNSLPTWDECRLIIENAEFDRRAALGLEGRVLDAQAAPKPTALHRFIYEYDDADPYRSEWFLHRLEKVVEEAVADRLAALEEENGRLLSGIQRISEWADEVRRDSEAHELRGQLRYMQRQLEALTAGGAE